MSDSLAGARNYVIPPSLNKAMDQALFPSIEAGARDLARAAARAEREKRVREHRESMRICWPDWDGDLSVGAQIECHSCIATRADDGSPLYCYAAPCKIVVVIDDNTFIAEIDYPADIIEQCAWLGTQNGIRLRLDICDVWVPCRLLWEARRRKENDDGNNQDNQTEVQHKGI